MTAAILFLAVAAGYTVGIVSVNDVIAQIDVNIGSVETYLEKNQNTAEMLTEEYREEYAAKTRTIALILAQDSAFLTDDRTLEELRVTVNADLISVSDTEGNVIASTDPSGAGSSVREEFRSHLHENVYTEVLFLLESDAPTIVAASTLDGGNGLVQISFSADAMVSILQDADLANTAADMPLYTSGTTAILETDTLQYISCTDTEKIGSTAEYTAAQMEKKKGKFDIENADGKRELVHYQTCGDYIILASVPYSDLYHMRNVLIGWILCGGAFLLVVIGLALRMQMIRQEKDNRK